MRSLALLALAPMLAIAQTAPNANADHQAAVDKLLAEPNAPQTIDAVVLSSKDGDARLQPVSGTFATTYAFVTVLMFLDFPELHATTTTSDALPSLHVKSGTNPRGRAYLVRLESNTKKGTRSLKMGTSGFGSVGSLSMPDKQWAVDAEWSDAGNGVWQATPTKALVPGDYGLFVPTSAAGMQVPMSGQVYDFTVLK